jgi:flagellar hook protein FlgE
MSLLTSLFTGASGMGAHGSAISVVGDNVANVSTVGFKRTRAGFADVLGGTLAGQRLGAGVRLGALETQFAQGSLQQTDAPLDLAVRGNGLFVVSGSHDGRDAQYYTRDGRFSLDNTGYVVNPGGLRLQGYTIDATGAVATTATDLQLAGVTSAPAATTTAGVALSLDASAQTTPLPPFDPANPAATSNFATSLTVYDSLGAPHRVDVYLRAQGAGAWEWHAMVDGGELTGGTAGTPTEIATGTLTFDANGALDVETPGASAATFLGAAPQTISFDFGDAITTDGGTGRAGTTQPFGASAVVGLDVDGHGAGTLMDLAVDADGTITGRFDNGERRALARVALATFVDEAGLERAGSGLFAQSSASGPPLVAAAATGGRGAIVAGALEGSNVDLGDELVTMIAYQRAFQANVKTVTTADEMLAEVASIKR